MTVLVSQGVCQKGALVTVDKRKKEKKTISGGRGRFTENIA